LLKIDAIDFFELGILDDDAGTEKRTQIRVAGMGPAGFEQLLLQGQCTIEDKTTRTGETTHLMPLLSLRPQFKPISLQTNLHSPLFAFCSPHSASLTQLDSGFNIQFLEIQF